MGLVSCTDPELHDPEPRVFPPDHLLNIYTIAKTFSKVFQSNTIELEICYHPKHKFCKQIRKLIHRVRHNTVIESAVAS